MQLFRNADSIRAQSGCDVPAVSGGTLITPASTTTEIIESLLREALVEGKLSINQARRVLDGWQPGRFPLP